MKHLMARTGSVLLICGALTAQAAGQQAPRPQQPANGAVVATAGAVLPPGYVIGPEDILSVVFWRDKDFSADVVVRPDGKISLPQLNDLQAAGFTPEQLSNAVEAAAKKYILDADATVIVKEIRSRKVFVVGEVAKPGTVALNGEMKVLQVIAEVGGFLDHAKKSDVVIVRDVNGREERFKFNYTQVVRGNNVEQNITLQPGDTVLVR
jgi:polysaccharide export outer membrane protein